MPCGNCGRPSTYTNKSETINRCDRCYDEGLGLRRNKQDLDDLWDDGDMDPAGGYGPNSHI